MTRHRGAIHRAGPSVAGLCILALVTLLMQPAGAFTGITELVSKRASGLQGNDISGRFSGPAISSNGAVVAFDSQARNMVPNDTNFQVDVFAHDRATNVTERVSVTSAGGQANDDSTRPAIDGTGNLVVFDSSATNLVPGDTNSSLDVFLHNRSANTTERISLNSREAQGNNQSHTPTISVNGRFVAFTSDASNFVPNDPVPFIADIFVRDLQRGLTERVSVNSAGEGGNSSSTVGSISANGRFVAFISFATNLVPDDTNGHFDTFVHDRTTGITERVSVSSDETEGDAPSSLPTVSGNGRFIAFFSDATNLVPNDTNNRQDIFVRDRVAGTTERVSVSSEEVQANGNSQDPGVRGFTASAPDISANGRFVAFFSAANNLVPGDTNTCPPNYQSPGTCPDAFVRDRLAGTTERVSVAPDGTQANERSSDPVLSENGFIALWSAASTLVPGDLNTCPGFSAFPGNCPDIFVGN